MMVENVHIRILEHMKAVMLLDVLKTKFLMSVFAGERSKFAYSKMSSRLECRVGKCKMLRTALAVIGPKLHCEMS